MPGIFILGPTQYKSDDGKVLETKLRRKTRALLAYICLNDKPLSREGLANIFCRNTKDPHASLRWHLSRIRRDFHEHALLINDDTIRVNRSSLWIDARAFSDRFEHAKGAFDIADVEETLKLYRGEVLSGDDLPGETEFELWLLGQRAHFARIFEKQALKLIHRLVEVTEYDKALTWAKTVINHNSTLEDAHYWLMWLYAHMGQTQVALQQYDVYQRHILQELGARGSDRLTALHGQISQNRLPAITAVDQQKSAATPFSEEFPFVGRSRELQELRRRWEGTAGGRGSAVMISGDAGIGKSTLVSQFLHDLPPDVTLFTSCSYESTMASTLAPWITIIRGCLHSVAANDALEIPAIIRGRLRLLVPDLITPDISAGRTVNTDDLNVDLLLTTIVDFFSLLASWRRFVIFIEDFHFADEFSVQLLSLLLNRLRNMPLLLLITQRPLEASDNPHLQVAVEEWQSIHSFAHIALGVLDEESISELIERVVPEAENKQEFAQKLIHHTQGISLHIREVLYAYKPQPHLLNELPIPLSFVALVSRRLRKLSASQRQLLETLAIIAYPATLSEIVECTGQNEVATSQNLDAAIKYRFIQSIQQDNLTTYEFSHFLYRDVIASKLSAARKQLLHRRVAQLYQNQAAIWPETKRADVVMRVVYHARLANDIACLTRWIPIAANTARNTFAYRQALELYEVLDSALQQAPRLPRDEYIRILLKMVELLRFLGDWKAQAAILQRIDHLQATRPMANPELLLSFLVEYGTNLSRSGKYAEATSYLEQAIVRGTEAGHTHVVAQARNSLGNIAYFQSNWDSAEENYSQAITLRETLDDEIGVGKGYNNLGAVAYYRGDLDRAAEYFRKNLAIREKRHDPHGIATALNNIGSIYLTLCRWDDASEQFQRALDIRKELDDQHGTASTLLNLAKICTVQQRYSEAIGLHRQSLHINERINDRAGVAHNLAALGEIYINLRQYDSAILHLQQSLDIRRELKNKYGMAESMLDLSYARALQDSALPDDMFFDVLQYGYDIDSNQIMCWALEKLAWLLVLHGDQIQAARYAGLVDAHKQDQRRFIVNDIVSSLRTSLGEAGMRDEMLRGTQMDLRQVVAGLLANRAS